MIISRKSLARAAVPRQASGAWSRAAATAIARSAASIAGDAFLAAPPFRPSPPSLLCGATTVAVPSTMIEMPTVFFFLRIPSAAVGDNGSSARFATGDDSAARGPSSPWYFPPNVCVLLLFTSLPPTSLSREEVPRRRVASAGGNLA